MSEAAAVRLFNLGALVCAGFILMWPPGSWVREIASALLMVNVGIWLDYNLRPEVDS